MNKVQRQKWSSIEFLFYYAVIAFAAFYAVKETLFISSPNHPAYPKYSSLLQEGWIHGRKIDLSDHQFKSFREGIPALTIFFSAFALCNRIFVSVHSRLVGTILFLFILHGFKCIEPLLMISFNFFIVKTLKMHQNNLKYITAFTWIYSIVCLFMLDSNAFSFINYGWLGAMPRWSVIFKISILRMISFNLDFASENVAIECCTDSCEKCRSKKPAKCFGSHSYFMYIFYPPLYLSGPIITFNDFSHQVNSLIGRNNVAKPIPWLYGGRLIASLLGLEVSLHYFYIGAIKNAEAWDSQFGPLAYAAIAFFNLKLIWMKLLVIWRFARFFALLDGVDPPENMIRCMSNNYSILRFWRAWHRSFNLWILKYLYVPLGGRKTAHWNIFPIFAFVALWHDVNWQLLAWGALIPLFILPELIATRFLAKNAIFAAFPANMKRHSCAIAAALNIFLMMLANLVGFSVGLKGAQLLLHQILGKGGLWFICSVFLVFFSATQLMFEIRNREKVQYGKYPST